MILLKILRLFCWILAAGAALAAAAFAVLGFSI